MLAVNVLPILYTVYMSFTNRNGPRRFPEGQYQLTGIENYIRLLSEPDFYLVLGRTLGYVAACLPLFFVFGLAFALALNHPAIKAKVVFRTLMILPWAIPTFVTALIWKFLFHGTYGPINQLLALVGIQGPEWLLSANTAFLAITAANLWMSFPFFMLTFLGGLQSIPEDIYEASSLDGAGYWTQLFKITLPMLRPVIVPALILSAVTTFGMYGTVQLMTGGGPVVRVDQPGATELLMVWAYNQGFTAAKRFGLQGAIAVVMFFIMGSLTLLAARLSRATRSATG
jgi:arabinogalactan oligomer/maltooligosaccharide transport system permease protein